MLCSKKTFNFESFEFPSWEFKNIFWGVYPHQTRAPCTICIPPNRKGHIDPSFPQGGAHQKELSINGQIFILRHISFAFYFTISWLNEAGTVPFQKMGLLEDSVSIWEILKSGFTIVSGLVASSSITRSELMGPFCLYFTINTIIYTKKADAKCTCLQIN